MKDNYDVSKLTVKKKGRINSKAKGGRFERKVADMLNKRFNTSDFCRTPGSGAFATTHSLPEYLKIYGDLITPKGFKFIIECKSGYNKEGICNLFNSNSIISDMIAQAERDSIKSKKNYLLIIGNDRQDPIVITNAIIAIIPNDYIRIDIGGRKLLGMKLESLLTLSNEFFIE
jgi:hypothetical protein